MAYAGPCPGQTKDGSALVENALVENALVENEQAWAKALEHRDTAALDCLLAAAAKHQPVHHELTEMQAHVNGDFGYIRGLATAVDAQGKVQARVRFTDIYVYRDGRWQAVAAHESMLPETK